MTIKTERLASADILKALAIFAVPFVHGVLTIPFKPSTFDLAISANLIGHVTDALHAATPIFIFLWAYFQEKSILKRGSVNSFGRFYKLLIPFLFWSMLYFLLTADFNQLTIKDIITKHWTGYGWSGQYYFLLMFQFLLLYPVIARLSRRLVRFVPAVYIFSFIFYTAVSYSGWFELGMVAKISDRVFIYWLPYCVLGIIYAHRNIFKFSLPLPIALVAIALVPMEIVMLHPQMVSQFVLPSVFLADFILISAIMRSEIGYSNLPVWLAKLVQVMSANTLAIFCINTLVVIVFKSVLTKMDFYFQFPTGVLLIPFIGGCITLAICLLIAKVLKRLKLDVLVAN